MSKVKSIPKEQVEKLIKQVEQLEDYANMNEVYAVAGYTRAWAKHLLVQLKAGYIL